MIERRARHKSVAIKNKLFVVGGTKLTCEVFDSTFNKFVLLKSPQENFKEHLKYPGEVVSIGNELLVFCDRFGKYSKSVLFYDVDKDVWLEESWKVEKYFSEFSCVKVPQL